MPVTSSGTDVKNAFVNAAAGGTDGAFITAVPGRRIRVLAAVLSGSGTATSVTFNSKPAGAGVAISAAFTCGVNDMVSLPFNDSGWFATVAGEGLTTTTGAGTTVGIHISYIEDYA